MKNKLKIKRHGRHSRIRQKIIGLPVRPRAVVFKSLKNIQIQLIDDISQKTLLLISSVKKEIKNKIGTGGGVKAAGALGEIFAKEAKSLGFKKIVFDRGGYPYHGRIKAVAESLRKEGLEF